MTIKDEQLPQAPRPTVKPADQAVPLQVQCFPHKGEMVVAFNQPVYQWFLSPESAREFARVFTAVAAQLEMQQAGGATKQ